MKPHHAPRRAGRAREAVAVYQPGVGDRLRGLVELLGSNRVADLLDVSPSQPSRWRSGAERLSADSRRRVLDLDYVMTRLLQLYPAEQAKIWLSSHNPQLGARPVDVLRQRGAAPVIIALDAEEAGVFA